MRAKLFRPHQYFSNSISIIISILLSSLIIPGHNAKYDSRMYEACKEKTTSACGKSVEGGIEFPFWGGDFRSLDCGLKEFELSCDESGLAVNIGSSYKFHVVEINPSEKALQLNHIHPLDSFCGSSSIRIPDTTLNEKLYSYSQRTEYLRLFYHCSEDIKSPPFNPDFTCGNEDEDKVYFFPDNELLPALKDEFSSCYNTTLLVDKMVLQEYTRDRKTLQPQALFDRSFEVMYNVPNQEVCTDCINAHGLCWFGTYFGSNDPCLYQQSGLPPSLPPSLASGKRDNSRLIVGIATGLGGGFLFILLAVFFVFYRRRKTKQGSYAVSRNVSSYSFSMSDSEKGSGTHMGVRIFSDNELEKATNNFDSNNELGDGGFGTVYKGKLQDGREVAVKRLYENSIKRVEQFMNEIVILTQLRHPNLVVLYGSTSQQCRNLLLVYEYIPNGTIADHLYGEDAERKNLTWKTRMSIAIETASALSYLHLSDVIHRDVKTTNILLDNNCHVKVADFGLSRLFPLHVTHVSTAPQGTPGYVDPEYHQCYQLTSKSDVYSFGVVLIELISSKPAVDITRHRHEINLATMAINKIQGDALHELVDPNLGFESDYEVRKMITEVAELAFRCLQHERESRPSMDEVYKTLKDIQSRNNGEKNESEYNLSKDDASLLKNYPQNLSPDSVTVKWISTTNSSSSS